VPTIKRTLIVRTWVSSERDLISVRFGRGADLKDGV
jgi:hypothetical protein